VFGLSNKNSTQEQIVILSLKQLRFNMCVSYCNRKSERKLLAWMIYSHIIVLKDCANVIAKPLTHIINSSLTTGVFPTDWKLSKLIPIPKSKPYNRVENYRPISVIPAISKVIEKLVYRQLSTYLENNNLLDESQFGFRKGRSTELAAMLFTDNVKRKVDEGKLVGAVFIDLTKAFD
jgi:hypothetical protein